MVSKKKTKKNAISKKKAAKKSVTKKKVTKKKSTKKYHCCPVNWKIHRLKAI